MNIIHEIALYVLIADVVAVVCYVGYMIERNVRARRGKGAALLLLALLPLGFSSCEKPDVVHGELEGYYDESTRLSVCTADSITRFSAKVTAFVAAYPEAKDDELYPRIKANVRDAWLQVTVNGTGWDGEETIGFTFGN